MIGIEDEEEVAWECERDELDIVTGAASGRRLLMW